MPPDEVRRALLLVVLAASGCATPDAAARRARYTTQLLEVIGEAAPESVTRFGLPGYEGLARDMSRASATDIEALERAAASFTKALGSETDAEARIDLRILEGTARRLAERTRLHERLLVDVPNLSRVVFEGLQPGLSPQASDLLRDGALARLQAYASAAFVDGAIASVRRDLEAGKLPPWAGEVRSLIATSQALDRGALQLADLAAPQHVGPLGEQLARWEQFLEHELAPRARADYRPPREVYLQELTEQGIDFAPEALATEARAAFETTYAQWRAVAKELGSDDPVALLKTLKQRQLQGDALLAKLKEANAGLEEIIRRERLLTLPQRPMAVRFMDLGETATGAVPTIDVGGAMQGAKEIALLVPREPAPGTTAQLDDFSFEAAAAPLCAHEGRPGHELQLTHAVERGLSATRTLFAFNTVNVEGWGLYAEKITRPYLSAEARFVSLQYLLVRQARAFLEPELVLGKIDEARVREVLGAQLGASQALVESELRRYTFDDRGQAPAYFVGLRKLERLRERAEAELGASFEVRRFHDAVLDRGFMPLTMLEEAVLSELRR